MDIQFGISSTELITALQYDHCSFFDGALSVWPVGNSYIFSMPWISLSDAAQQCFASVPLDKIKIGQNLVQIHGPMPPDEQPPQDHLHTHISAIVAGITNGLGRCVYQRDAKICRQNVRMGDIAVIPPGAPHTFEGMPDLEYMVIELGPELDYQKHHYGK